MLHRWAWVTVVVGCGTIHEPPAAFGVDARNDAGAAVERLPWSIINSSARLVTGNISLMADGSGVPHVAYSTEVDAIDELWHSWVIDGRLESERVDTGRGRRKVWVPGSVEPRLVYDSLTFNIIGFQSVRSSSGEWLVEASDFGVKSAGASAVWREGRLYLARLGTVEEEVDGKRLIRHGVFYDGQPLPASSTRLAGEAVPPQLAMAIDSRGDAHIVYSSPADDYLRYLPSDEGLAPHTIRYVTVSNGQWSEPLLMGGVAGQYDGLSIAIDASDTVHVGFVEAAVYDTAGDGALPWVLRHLTRSVGSEWADEVIPIGARAYLSRGSMALDEAGTPHFAYCFVEDEQARPRCSAVGYAHKRADEWHVEVIQAGCDRLGADAAIAVGGDGQAFVAYQGCNGELTFASRP